MKFIIPKIAFLLCSVGVSAHAQPNPEVANATQPNPEAMDKLARDIIGEIRAKVASRAPVDAFDAILERLNEIPTIQVPTPSPAFPGRVTLVTQLPPKFEAAKSFVIHWQEYLSSVKSGDLFMAKQHLLAIGRESVSGYTILPRSELLALQQTEEAEQKAAFKKIVDPIVSDLGDAMHSAETQDEFNAIVARIDAVLDKVRGDFSFDSTLRGLRKHAVEWRSYFAQSSIPGSSVPDMSKLLNQLNADPASYAIELRKKAVNRPPKNNPPATITADASKPTGALDPTELTLDNIELYAAEPRKTNDGNLPAFFDALLSLRSRAADGDYQSIYELYGSRSNAGYMTPPQFLSAMEKIRTKLVLEGLVIQFKATGIKPEPAEKIFELLERGIRAEIKAKRWNSVLEALQISRSLNPRNRGDYDVIAYQKLMVGINQEKARQYGEAKRSYLEALAMPGQFIPVDELTERLNTKEIAQVQNSAR